MKSILCLSCVTCVAILTAACLGQDASTQAATGLATPLPAGIDANALLAAGFSAVVEKTPGGQIDWTRGEIVVEGTGQARGTTGQDIAMAKRAARLVAARNALLVLGGLRVGPGERFENVKEGWIRADGAVEGLDEVLSAFDANTRTALVRLRLPIYGDGGAIRYSTLRVSTAQKLWAWPDEANDAAPEVIILDMRKCPFAPVLLPRLTMADGQVVSDASRFAKPRPLSYSAATYVKKRDNILKDMPNWKQPREDVTRIPSGTEMDMTLATLSAIWRNSTVIVGCSVNAGGKTGAADVVLSDAAVDYFRSHPRARRTLGDGRLIIIVDPPGEAKPNPQTEPSMMRKSTVEQTNE